MFNERPTSKLAGGPGSRLRQDIPRGRIPAACARSEWENLRDAFTAPCGDAPAVDTQRGTRLGPGRLRPTGQADPGGSVLFLPRGLADEKRPACGHGEVT